jgi:hypothetical protein
VLDALKATNGTIFIRTDTRAETLIFEILRSNSSGAAGSLTWYEWSGTAWVSIPHTDNTKVGGVPMVQDGALVRTDTIYSSTEKPREFNNKTGYWYKITTSGLFDAEVEVSSVRYSSLFHDIDNVWNGVPEFAIEAQHDDNSAGIYKRYAASTVSVPSMTSSDALYFSTIDPIEAIYADVGDTPNTATVTLTIAWWNGTGWTNYTGITDGTSGLNQTGWIRVGRQTGQFPTQFNNSQYTAYWYKITTNVTFGSSTEFSLKYQPYYDITDFGRLGTVNCSWKDRALWSFNNNEVIVSQKARPMVLNGTDYAVLNPGDGRSNKVVAMINFYNEVVMFQEEQGTEGGCITLYEGYSPATFGKLVLSTRFGTFSPKSVTVVDGSLINLTDSRSTAMTQIYFLSHYGVGMTDGQTATIISQAIQNYFDPRFSECIRRGYESEMWIGFDSNNQCVRMGLVSGASATKCNIFPVLDLIDGSWYFDSYANSMSFLTELEGASGQIQTLQYSGGSISGQVYRQNDGTNDDGTAIDAQVTFEFHNGGWLIDVQECLPSFKVAAGNVTITSYENGQQKKSETLSMTGNKAGAVMRRVRHLLDTKQTESVSIKIQCNTLDLVMYLYYMGLIASSEEYK